MKLLLVLSSLVAAPLFAASGGDLDANDYVGVSFWLVTAALLAATVFFFLERDNVGVISGKLHLLYLVLLLVLLFGITCT